MFANCITKCWPFYCQKLVLNNITREWEKFANRILPTNVFHGGHVDDSNNLSTEAFNFYSSNLNKLINDQTSFGIIYQHSFNADHHEQQHILNSTLLNQSISLIIFCHKHETLKIQQMLTRTRFHWYRKLSKSPLNSGFQTNLNENDNIFNISYQTKHIDSFDSLKLDHIILDQNNQEINLKNDCDIIICKSNLKNCLLAFLDDSFTITSDEKYVMKLNPQLVPFKLALIVDEETSKKAKSKLYDVANYLIELLQEHSDLSILPFVPETSMSINRCDTLAVKYCIILKEETLKNGVVYLRNRDTLLSEMVHISNLLKTLLFYLQPEKIITFEEQQHKHFHKINS